MNQERERLEIEQKQLVKELSDLMNKLNKDNNTDGLITLDIIHKTSKPFSKAVKKEIISMDVDSASESDTSESESDEKPKLVANKGKKLVPIKTTKGGKGLNLTKPDSDSESDEDCD